MIQFYIQKVDGRLVRRGVNLDAEENGAAVLDEFFKLEDEFFK